jgi:hypothetical protein
MKQLKNLLLKQKWLLLFTVAVITSVAAVTATSALLNAPNAESNAAAALRKQKAKITLEANTRDASASSATQGSAVGLRATQGSNANVGLRDATYGDTTIVKVKIEDSQASSAFFHIRDSAAADTVWSLKASVTDETLKVDTASKGTFRFTVHIDTATSKGRHRAGGKFEIKYKRGINSYNQADSTALDAASAPNGHEDTVYYQVAWGKKWGTSLAEEDFNPKTDTVALVTVNNLHYAATTPFDSIYLTVKYIDPVVVSLEEDGSSNKLKFSADEAGDNLITADTAFRADSTFTFYTQIDTTGSAAGTQGALHVGGKIKVKGETTTENTYADLTENFDTGNGLRFDADTAANDTIYEVKVKGFKDAVDTTLKVYYQNPFKVNLDTAGLNLGDDFFDPDSAYTETKFGNKRGALFIVTEKTGGQWLFFKNGYNANNAVAGDTVKTITSLTSPGDQFGVWTSTDNDSIVFFNAPTDTTLKVKFVVPDSAIVTVKADGTDQPQWLKFYSKVVTNTFTPLDTLRKTPLIRGDTITVANTINGTDTFAFVVSVDTVGVKLTNPDSVIRGGTLKITYTTKSGTENETQSADVGTAAGGNKPWAIITKKDAPADSLYDVVIKDLSLAGKSITDTTKFVVRYANPVVPDTAVVLVRNYTYDKEGQKVPQDGITLKYNRASDTHGTNISVDGDTTTLSTTSFYAVIDTNGFYNGSQLHKAGGKFQLRLNDSIFATAIAVTDTVKEINAAEAGNATKPSFYATPHNDRSDSVLITLVGLPTKTKDATNDTIKVFVKYNDPTEVEFTKETDPAPAVDFKLTFLATGAEDDDLNTVVSDSTTTGSITVFLHSAKTDSIGKVYVYKNPSHQATDTLAAANVTLTPPTGALANDSIYKVTVTGIDLTQDTVKYLISTVKYTDPDTALILVDTAFINGVDGDKQQGITLKYAKATQPAGKNIARDGDTTSTGVAQFVAVLNLSQHKLGGEFYVTASHKGAMAEKIDTNTIAGLYYHYDSIPGQNRKDSIVFTVFNLQTDGDLEKYDTTALVVKYLDPAVVIVSTDNSTGDKVTFVETSTAVAGDLKVSVTDTVTTKTKTFYFHAKDTLTQNDVVTVKEDGTDLVKGTDYTISTPAANDSVYTIVINEGKVPSAGDTLRLTVVVGDYVPVTVTIQADSNVWSVDKTSQVIAQSDPYLQIITTLGEDTIKHGNYKLTLLSTSSPADSIATINVGTTAPSTPGTDIYAVVSYHSNRGSDDTLRVYNISQDTVIKVKYYEPDPFTVNVNTLDDDITIVKPANGTGAVHYDSTLTIVAELDESKLLNGTYKLSFGTVIGDTITVTDSHGGGDITAVLKAGTGANLRSDTIEVKGITDNESIEVIYEEPTSVKVTASKGQGLASVSPDTEQRIASNETFQVVANVETGRRFKGNYELVFLNAQPDGDTVKVDKAETSGDGITAFVTYGTGSNAGKDTIKVKGISADTTFTVDYIEIIDNGGLVYKIGTGLDGKTLTNGLATDTVTITDGVAGTVSITPTRPAGEFNFTIGGREYTDNDSINISVTESATNPGSYEIVADKITRDTIVVTVNYTAPAAETVTVNGSTTATVASLNDNNPNDDNKVTVAAYPRDKFKFVVDTATAGKGKPGVFEFTDGDAQPIELTYVSPADSIEYTVSDQGGDVVNVNYRVFPLVTITTAGSNKTVTLSTEGQEVAGTDTALYTDEGGKLTFNATADSIVGYVFTVTGLNTEDYSTSQSTTAGKTTLVVTIDGLQSNANVTVSYHLGEAKTITFNSSYKIATTREGTDRIGYIEVDQVSKEATVFVTVPTGTSYTGYTLNVVFDPIGAGNAVATLLTDTTGIYEVVLSNVTENATVTVQYRDPRTVNLNQRDGVRNITHTDGTSGEYVIVNDEVSFKVKINSGLTAYGTFSVRSTSTDYESAYYELIGRDVNYPNDYSAPYATATSVDPGDSTATITIVRLNSSGYNYNVRYYPYPTVKVVVGTDLPAGGVLSIQSDRRQGVAYNGNYSFNIGSINSVLANIKNGGATAAITSGGGPNATVDDDYGYYIYLSDLDTATEVTVGYEQKEFKAYVQSGTTGVYVDNRNASEPTTVTNGVDSFRIYLADEIYDASIRDNRAFRTGGTFAFVFGEYGYNSSATSKNITAEVKAVGNTGRIFDVKVHTATGNNPVQNLYVTVGYAEPGVIVTPTPPTTPDLVALLPDLDALPGLDDGTLLVGKNRGASGEVYTGLAVVNDGTEAAQRLYRKATLVPTEQFRVEGSVQNQSQVISITPQNVIFRFEGALAKILPSLTAYNVRLTKPNFTVVYKFVSSVRSIGATQLRSAADSYVAFDEAKSEFTIYLIDIDMDVLNIDEPTTTTLAVVIGDEDVIVAELNEEFYLYDHPIYLDPDNGVPGVGHSGYFILNGSYPADGQFRYRLENDTQYKIFDPNTGLTNSEIDRLAQGELLYLAYAVDQRYGYNDRGEWVLQNGTPNQIYIYKPKTYAGVDNGGTPDVSNPIVRRVDVQAASGANLTFSAAGVTPATEIGGFTVNEAFTFNVAPAVEDLLPGGKLFFQFLKDGIEIPTTPVVTGDTDTDGDGVFNVTISRIKTSGLLVIVDYRVATGNAAVNTAKAWTNNNQLYISSTNNGTAKVYSINGQLVKTVTLEAGTTTITDLPNGNYVIALPTGKTEKVNAR